MQHDTILSWKNILIFWPHPRHQWCVFGQNMCVHGAVCSIPISLINYAIWILSEKTCFDLYPTPGVEGAWKDRLSDCMLLHSSFPLIWYAIWPCSEKDEFWPFDPTLGPGEGSMGKIFATMLMLVSFPLFDMQHDHILKKLNFGLCLSPLVHPGGAYPCIQTKIPFDMCFISIVSLSACEISVKLLTTDCVIAKCKYLTFDPAYGVRGLGKILITVMFIYRHRVFMACSEKLWDIKVLWKREEKAKIAFAFKKGP